MSTQEKLLAMAYDEEGNPSGDDHQDACPQTVHSQHDQIPTSHKIISIPYKPVLRELLTLDPHISKLPGHLDSDLLVVGLILHVPIM